MLSPLIVLCALKEKKKHMQVFFSYLSIFLLADFPHALEIYLLTEGEEDMYFTYLIGAPAHISSTLQLSSWDCRDKNAYKAQMNSLVLTELQR